LPLGKTDHEIAPASFDQVYDFACFYSGPLLAE
jgi:hypothetical protein